MSGIVAEPDDKALMSDIVAQLKDEALMSGIVAELKDEALMSGIVAEPEDEAVALERMLDDGGPAALPRRARGSRWTPLRLPDEPSAEERIAQRRASRRVFRLYCFACGRSSEVAIAPARPGRCIHCGGTMLVEVAPD
jgi:hypothetical protein